jgi:membrane associated rhomboid family serine protease
MQAVIQNLLLTFSILKLNLSIVLTLLGILWGVQFLNWILSYRLNVFGIYPRHPSGLIGIFCAPFLHGHFDHLFFNSIPFFILASFVLLGGVHNFFVVSSIIIVLSGLGIWLFGRKSRHIGASSLIMGYFGYCLMNAYYHVSVVSIGIGLVCLYYFGSLLFSVFPSDMKTSWEGHLFGLLSGIATVYLISFFR